MVNSSSQVLPVRVYTETELVSLVVICWGSYTTKVHQLRWINPRKSCSMCFALLANDSKFMAGSSLAMFEYPCVPAPHYGS